jgi:hypothetical protein
MVNMAPDNHADMADAYKEYFDLLTATRDERTKYNQYFITLLFTDTLFAIFTALLGASSATVYANLVWLLLLATLCTAIGISFVWVCKLWTLGVVHSAETDVLEQLEKKLYGLGLINTFISKQERRAHKNFLTRFLWGANYWGMPVIFLIIFAIIFIVVAWNPSAFAVPANATQNVSLHL